jgi:ubiquitin carboxyl-terminal hydrolase 7
LKVSFGEPELLSEVEGNGWRPEKGADKVDAHKGSSLLVQGLPPILQLHLKRFNYDWQFEQMSKINDRFSFPEVLDLSSVCSNIEKDQEDRAVYDLQSVVVHAGECGVGHYYAYVRPDVRKEDWYRFNDDIVERVSFKEVTEDAFGGRSAGVASTKKRGWFAKIQRAFQGSGGTYGWGGSTSNAYVVQYVKRCDIPMLYLDE